MQLPQQLPKLQQMLPPKLRLKLHQKLPPQKRRDWLMKLPPLRPRRSKNWQMHKKLLRTR